MRFILGSEASIIEKESSFPALVPLVNDGMVSEFLVKTKLLNGVHRIKICELLSPMHHYHLVSF